ncbi:LSM7-like protein [Rozella allomycis CSF55]|uniref:LSM7-like protein n=1 Tax=Rozella allomycis (strain CSF55) TaxID=988480 RepID=A0A075AMZ1_ROZAC|nr:U6 snRNA-associated Sm-like protein LSm7 [Rozella allomycis CSF55]RKP22062.1 LSM7-like protein [Rozella allomycis CSF55]|eukprot:EPZ31086.1 U6 snRNA-associated Sm-like protein LSm7 [Rozella allomycis CSF55]
MSSGNSRGRGTGRNQGTGRKQEPQKRESILEYQKYENKMIRVKFHGGREVQGVLKGHDNLMNLVLDDTVELMRDPSDLNVITEKKRNLGLVVCRGTQIIVISPVEGMKEIPNPFQQ